MKKAFIDQLFLGFLLLTTIALFVATVNDERSTNDRISELRNLARSSSQAMAGHYTQQINMCTAEIINDGILRQSPLGNMVLDNNLVTYIWMDTDADGEPDQVRTTIDALNHSTFWYRLFGKDFFQIGPFDESVPIIPALNVNINYGGTNAGYNNMIGTYQLDANNCVTNTRFILADAQNTPVGQQLGNQITTPPTFIFIAPNGFNNFTNSGYTPNNNDILNLGTPHCFGANTQPALSIAGQTANNSRIYFEHNQLNTDGFAHIQVIPTTIWPLYNDYVNGTGRFAGNGVRTYNQFIAYATILNNDNDNTNNINFTTDPNNQFQYAMEDLDNGGDQDFNDIFLNTTRVAIANQLNRYTINDDGSINLLDCNRNNPPVVTIQNCPITINEDTSTNAITWTATDTDGNVVSTNASALNGAAAANNDGTISYTPNVNYFGTDTIRVQATDNQGGVGFGNCAVNINEINDAPTINGIPNTSAVAGNLYTFTFTARDPDNEDNNPSNDDVLAFTITNKPAWATFDTGARTLSGTPTESDVGIYSNIVISVSDGRGGSASLPSFNIEVLSNNGAPILVSPIPDKSVVEGNIFTYNASTHFRDPNGDTLSYSITGAVGATINSVTGIINYNIPDGAAVASIPIKVTASDGTYSKSDTFILTITANGNCNGPFKSTFTSNNSDNWKNSDDYPADASGNNLKVYGRLYVYRSFYFGTGCKEKNITLTFDYKTNKRWERSDKFEVWSNEAIDADKVYNKTGNSWRNKTTTLKTDDRGWLIVYFYAHTNRTDEIAYVDNINLTSE